MVQLEVIVMLYWTKYKKSTEAPGFHNDPFRAVSFPVNEAGNPVCPNNKEFHFLRNRHIRGSHYGRYEEL